jgi:hypothetical protein
MDNFRKKALSAYWLLLEPAPTSALFTGLLENDSPLTLPKARPPSFSHLSVALSSSLITLPSFT